MAEAKYDMSRFLDETLDEAKKEHNDALAKYSGVDKQTEEKNGAAEPAKKLQERKSGNSKRSSVEMTGNKTVKTIKKELPEKKSLTILLPADIYIGLKMMSFNRMQTVTGLICDLYREEEAKEKRRSRV